jgi:hypothetical protein
VLSITQKKLDEEKSKYASLVQEFGLGSTSLHHLPVAGKPYINSMHL